MFSVLMRNLDLYRGVLRGGGQDCNLQRYTVYTGIPFIPSYISYRYDGIKIYKGFTAIIIFISVFSTVTSTYRFSGNFSIPVYQ